MNQQNRAKSYFIAVAALGLLKLSAQTAPSASSTESSTVTLDPFNVSAQSDVGFVAANSLAGGRIATALKDTPVAYSVLTSEFLEAFNINDAGRASEFSVNSNQYYNDGLNGVNGATTITVRIRGQTANTPTRNFFPYSISTDSYNVDRIDFARGANASLFGAGGSAGTQNTVSKQALTTRTIREVRAQVGSWDRYRLTADFNQPITKKIALRTNLLWSDGHTWRLREWESRKGISFAGTWNISPKFSMRAEYEFRTTDKAVGTDRSKDDTSAWDGKFTASGIDLNMTAAQMAVVGVTRQVRRYVRDPDNLRTAVNTQNMFVTKGAVYNAAATNYLDGKPIRSVGVTFAGMSMTEVWDHPSRFAAAQAGSPFFILPGRTFTPLWDVDRDYPGATERAEDISVYFTARPFEGFFAELSGDRNRVERWSEYAAGSGAYNMQVDINRNKPNGDPNPYFMQPYSEFSPYSFHKNPGYHSANLQLTYVKDTRWGKLQLGAMGGIQNLALENRQDYFLLPLQKGVVPGDDFRSYFGSVSLSVPSVFTRQYTALRGKVPSPHTTQEPLMVTNPLTGIRASTAPKWFVLANRPGSTDDTFKKYKFAQAAANLNLFKNHLVLVGAVRRDLTVLEVNNFTYTEDMPAGWDGSYYTFRPNPPADYWSLRYIPKNASGQALATVPIPAEFRPRAVVNATNLALAQYKNDRFQDDYSPPDVISAVNTRSFGAVVNLTSWFGIYANDSTTFDLNAGSINADLKLIPPTSSQSYDAGIRFNQPNGKLSASIGWFRAFQQGAPFGVGFNFRQNINSIADSPVVGDLSEGGRNIRGFGQFISQNVTSTLTRETDGYEAEVTANLTRSWRLMINAGKNRPVQKDVMPDLPGWIAGKNAVLRQILADSGVTIDANNQAFINPALNDPTKINVLRVQTAADAWNNYQQVTIPTILATNAAVSRQTGGPELTANIATDYRFTQGRLNGLRAGIAINYRGRQILGARTADTIVDPANPARAIPGPDSVATNYLWAGGYTNAAANLSYTVRLKEGGRRYAPKSIQFDLAVDNLFGRSAPIIETSSTGSSTANGLVLAPRNNDISNPSIVSIPGSYNFQAPRNYTLTAKLNF